jgi:hypothetical protein
MTRRSFPWSRLGIDPTSDTGAIRKAYADVLRSINPDEDIAGFADLRRARDQALWEAARLAAQQGPSVGDNDGDDDAGGDLYGLGGLDEDDDPDWDEGDGDYEEGAWDIAPAFTRGPGAGSAPTPELTEAQQHAQAAWDRLHAALYPGGEFSEDAVTHAEFDEGLAALTVLIARAEEADLEEHDALDSALADLFARTWPRSAPFVEPANAAFHWLGEAGALEERYSLRFLNDRLKGMRFHEKVQQPGHPLHKAWEELSRPGRAGVFDRLKVNRLDVHRLLLGMRERYPELEAHLDSERVASWEGAGAGSAEGFSNAGRGFGGAVLFVVLFFALVRGIAVLGGADGDAESTLSPPSALIETSPGERDAEVAAVFGPDMDMAKLRAIDPVFADQFAQNLSFREVTGGSLTFVRNKALQTAEIAKFEELVALGELKQMWLAAASKIPGQCQNVMAGDFSSLPLALGAAETAREQALLRRLLDARLLNHRATKRGTSFSVPGWAVDKMLKKSGLTIDELTAALKNPEHPKRCLVDLTMSQVILAEPGRVSADVLRAL